MQFAVAYASIIFLKKKWNAVSSLHRLCIASTSCYRSYIATKKLKKYEKNNTKTFDGKENRLFMRKSAQLTSAFVFAIRSVQFHLYISPKCQAFSHLLWLYSSVCVGLSETPKTGSYFDNILIIFTVVNMITYR